MPVLDLPLAFAPNEPAPPVPARNAGDTTLDGLCVVAVSRPEELASDWKQLEKFGHVPFSGAAWATAWYEAHRDDPNVSPLIVVGRAANGEPLFLLPLARERRGPFTMLVWPGGTHSAYHCGLFSPACRELVTPDNAKAFWARVFAALPPADALALYGLPAFEIERRNPLSHLPLLGCGCASYRMALSPDWAALYTTKASAKMRSNDRRSERRLAQHGTLRFRVAQTREERRRMLDSLVAQKSARFRQHGQPNFFDKPRIRAFYERLLENSDRRDTHCVFMSALDLGDTCIAVNLGMTQGSSFHGMIVSMAGGSYERFGPGRVLLRRSIEHLCHRGFKEFDFGVGEDPYKDHWRDEMVERRDVLVPLNAKGSAFIAALKLFLKTKAFIKRSPLFWRPFSRYRRYLGC